VTKVTIDDKEYDLDTLSDECKAQLASIQFVEQELARLQAKADALQTAKVIYLQAFKSSLTVTCRSDTNSPKNLINLNQTRSPSQIELNTLLKYYQKGQLDLAQNLATKLTKRYPNHSFGWKVLGAMFGQTETLQNAVIANQKALEITPNDAIVHYNLGNTLKELGRIQEAYQCYKKAIVIKPDFAQAYSNLGDTLRKLDRLEDAEVSLKKAIGINPEYALAHSNLGNILKDLGRLKEAETSYKKSIAIKPDYAEAHYNLGITLHELDRLEDAEISYRKAITIKPDFAEAHSNLGITLHELDRLDDAEISYRKAITIKPDFAEAHSNLGNTLQELGRLEDAEASYNKAIAIKPDYADALLNKAKLNICQNKIIDSIKSLEHVIKINNGDTSLIAAVTLAVLNFQADDLYSAQLLIEDSKDILQINNKSANNDKHYHNLLKNLISWHNINEGFLNNHIAQKLYIVGESNALISNKLFIKNLKGGSLCKVQWIVGCKQWHLGNSSPNKYKEQFERVFRSLPDEAIVLLSVGEIDCRLDDGILKHIKNHPSKILSEVVKSTVENYLAYVYKITSIKSNHVIIQGVPCPNVDPIRVGSNDISILVDLIKAFNFELFAKSKENGFEFLDLHTLTDRGDGYSNGIWNIDEHHLSPAGMLEAWRIHLDCPTSNLALPLSKNK
jgi:tetratricopeptide (TPR) repeat protein